MQFTESDHILPDLAAECIPETVKPELASVNKNFSFKASSAFH